MFIGSIYLGGFLGVEGKLINFICLYLKGFCLILLKRIKEVEENIKINFMEF